MGKIPSRAWQFSPTQSHDHELKCCMAAVRWSQACCLSAHTPPPPPPPPPPAACPSRGTQEACCMGTAPDLLWGEHQA